MPVPFSRGERVKCLATMWDLSDSDDEGGSREPMARKPDKCFPRSTPLSWMDLSCSFSCLAAALTCCPMVVPSVAIAVVSWPTAAFTGTMMDGGLLFAAALLLLALCPLKLKKEEMRPAPAAPPIVGFTGVVGVDAAVLVRSLVGF